MSPPGPLGDINLPAPPESLEEAVAVVVISVRTRMRSISVANVWHTEYSQLLTAWIEPEEAQVGMGVVGVVANHVPMMV